MEAQLGRRRSSLTTSGAAGGGERKSRGVIEGEDKDKDHGEHNAAYEEEEEEDEDYFEWGEDGFLSADEGDSESDGETMGSGGCNSPSSPAHRAGGSDARLGRSQEGRVAVVSPGIPELSDGQGLFGPEGAKRLGSIMRPSSMSSLTSLFGAGAGAGGAKSPAGSRNSRPTDSISVKSTYGPGQSTQHPWTGRFDNGINSRIPRTTSPSPSASPSRSNSNSASNSNSNSNPGSPTSGLSDDDIDPSLSSPGQLTPGGAAAGGGGGAAGAFSRGDEIYYVGIIDILQQYNLHKRGETFIKVRLHLCFCFASSELVCPAWPCPT